METVLFAFLLTLLAGLSTGIGSALAFFTKHTNRKFLSSALGFSAGVMIYVSFVDLLPLGLDSIVSPYSQWIGVGSFFGGILVAALIDALVPSFENPHEVRSIEDISDSKQAKQFRKLHRVGIFTAIALAIHNFPEGIATFVSALSDPHLGIVLAIAIAIHNIPEGIAVSIPIYYATKSKKKAFWYSFLSGLAEPLGAVLAYFIFLPFITDTLMGVLFAAVAGIMVFISLDELFPTAREYGKHHLVMYGFVLGMAVMALSLLLLS